MALSEVSGDAAQRKENTFMSRRTRAPALLLILALLLTVVLPALPAAAQTAAPEIWRKRTPAVNDNFSRNTGQWAVDTGTNALRTIARGRLNIDIPEAELF